MQGSDRAQKGSSSSSTGHGSSGANVSTHKMASLESEGIFVSQKQVGIIFVVVCF